MKAVVIKLEQLFKMETGLQGELVNFNIHKRKLLIPLYQREYIWADEKIITLVNDVKQCNKYLGNVILDEMESCYEIVDGQQRITTCFLILMSLYNKYIERPREQESLMRLIRPYGEFILRNDSIGEYIAENNGVLSLAINPEKDVYYQLEDFKRALGTIERELEKLESHDKTLEFKRKLLDCEVLVLINDSHDNIHPVEQLFLDINEKAQLLEVEDIFKGHCFENFEEYYHQSLRERWIEFKKCAMGFKKFGYKNASDYIYLYLLEKEGNSLSKNLTLRGRHYLDGKNMDETESLLCEMISYGKSNLNFFNNLSNMEYRFADLCKDSYRFRDTEDHLVLKQMCKSMLGSSAAQYQKLPLLYFIYALSENEEIVNTISHEQFRKIITNIYVYMMLFIMGGTKKSKNDIDYTIRDALNSEDKIRETVMAAKKLREQKVESFILRENYGIDKLLFLCSVIDTYQANKNWIKKIYSRQNGYTLEHFVIPDNRNRRILWKDDNNTFELELPAEEVRLYKSTIENYLIMDRHLNELMEHDDIVSKIQGIKEWFKIRNESVPKHILIIIESIENMESYKRLKSLKGKNVSHEVITAIYVEFVKSYFEPENRIKDQLQNSFINSFKNS